MLLAIFGKMLQERDKLRRELVSLQSRKEKEWREFKSMA